ncbi:S41 family peptidase, partial [Candidatus Gracilibacteria bacterium]|nr:S41 family peptidase [Candidatus Gracilibacteria bacterium]
GAITGMVDALGDKNSEFMSPEATEKFNEVLEGDFEGIGAVVEKAPLGVKVERILKGSPAKKYDVRGGDIIIKADDVELEELDLYDAVDEIKGPAGSQVTLTIIRPGEDEILEISVVRQKIHIPSVEQEYFDEENIAYIAINMFGDTTSKEFISAVEEVKTSGAEGLIIDVRDNGGGYLQSAVQILSEFIPEKESLVKTRYKNSFFDENYSSVNDGELYEKAIVVLINENSASASEITAGALREYDKAILVGKKTYGKGSVQQPFDMEDGSLLKLTVAKWFTPNGKNIDEEGIMPDIEVGFNEEDYEDLYDRQLEEAKKVLKIFIDKTTIGLTIEEYEKQRKQ